MGKTIQAVYENGVFRPLEPLTLPEGERVQVIVPEKAAEIQQRLEAWEAFEKEFEGLTEEQWRQFEEAAQRRPLFGNRQLDL